MNRPELLAPAGNLEKLKIAILYGADAVYLGGKKFSLRSAASNFELEDIVEGVNFAHQNNAKVYVVANMIMHNSDLDGLKEYLQELEKIGVDGIICADLIVVDYLKKYAPSLEVHISTQQSVTNSYAVKFYEELGANRVVLAREISYEELEKIVEKSNIELEYFVHGAMCVAYSGRCMLSNYYSKRDSNRGGCSQSCRWNYDIFEDERQINDESNYFTMSSKDLNLSRAIPKLVGLGIKSLKIEGRMKSIYYLATIISTYRQIIDDYIEDSIEFEDNSIYDYNLKKAANRAVSNGFFDGKMSHKKQLYQNREEHPTKEFIGFVLDNENGFIKLEQRNYFEKGDKVELFGPNKEYYSFVVDKFYDEDMNEITVARHPQQIIYLPFVDEISKCSMLRKVI